MAPPPADRPAPAGAQLDALADGAFTATGATVYGATSALVVTHGGEIVLERYGDGVGPTTTLPVWSMAKSVLHAVVGMLVADGLLSVDDAVDHPAWRHPGDPRGTITVGHLLAMRPGLAWREDYVDRGSSDVMTMLWGDGRGDTAAFTASFPLAARPGTRYLYSSGTSNLLSWRAGRAVAASGRYPGGMAQFLDDRLFGPLGMTSPVPKFDGAGTWIASSYCFTSARDLARFGALYLGDGMVDGRRLLPEAWIERSRRGQGVDDEGWDHSEHWWRLPGRDDLTFANGFAGQYLFLSPEHDLAVVRLGRSEPDQRDEVVRLLLEVIEAAVARPAR